MDDSPVRYLIYIIVILILAGYFAGTEIALASVNKIRMATRAENGDRAAKRVLYVLDNFDKALTTLLIGNNITHAGIATLATLLTYTFFDSVEAMPDYAVTVSTVITTVVVFFVGEMIPKSFAKTCNESFAVFACGPLIILMKVLTPISFLFSLFSDVISRPFKKKAGETPTVTEEELYDIIETFVEENDIDEETEELVQNAIEFSESTVKDVMTPWDKVVKIHEDTPAAEVVAICKGCTHSRFPVINSKDIVIGTLSMRAFLKQYLKNPDIAVRDVMAAPVYINANTPVDDILTMLSGKRTHIAYVRGGKSVLGIITVEDILEELVGEIYDEEEKIGGAVDA